MKMGLNHFSAKDVVHKLDQKDLEKIFRLFGDEKDSKRIAYKIIKIRKNKKINTQDLVRIIRSSKRNINFKIHAATKVFQALRIFVNNEISELIYGLINATRVLKPGGIIVVVTFHSLEDKIVKYFFNLYSNLKKNPSRYLPLDENKSILFKLLSKKVITPDKKEISQNIRSRSAKLRYAIRNDKSFFYPHDFKKKFESYFEMEEVRL